MKLELLVSKRYVKGISGSSEVPVFAVVDLDKAKEYPANFVCLLPKTSRREGNPVGKFPEIYGKESNRIAVKLLTKALKKECSLGVREEIEKRLKALQPKPTTKCSTCGCTFEPRKFGHFLQTVCKACHGKDNSGK